MAVTTDKTYCDKIPVIMPSVLSDIDTLLKNAKIYFKYLPIKNIYVAAPSNVKKRLEQENDERIIYINENELVDIKNIKNLYSLRTDKNPERAGWYIQQFIKMQFSRFLDDEYYLIWDGDTIPLKPLKFFDDDLKPFFDMKTEYHVQYFDTIEKILPGIYKATYKSFISEHMIIKSEYMREMLQEIENNNNLNGKTFQEKIINAINETELPCAGFSEFETYGNYVTLRHAGSYVFRAWNSLRGMSRFYDNSESIPEDEISWLAKRYDAISIEKWQKKTLITRMIKYKLFRKIFSPAVCK